MNPIVHIASRTAWEASIPAGYYKPTSLESEGFIHCSTVEQSVDTANNFFHNQHGLVLLCIDVDKLDAELKYEPPAGGPAHNLQDGTLFPHLYGPLNVNAVVRVVEFEPDAEGMFSLPDEIENSFNKK
jgi:uncharacterized protein (DUF952 family)